MEEVDTEWTILCWLVIAVVTLVDAIDVDGVTEDGFDLQANLLRPIPFFPIPINSSIASSSSSEEELTRSIEAIWFVDVVGENFTL